MYCIVVISSRTHLLVVHLSIRVCKLDVDRVVVRENVAVRLDEVIRHVCPSLGGQADGATGAIEDLVDDLAFIGLGRNAAGIGVSAGHRECTTLDEIDPRVAEACVDELADAQPGVGVAVVGVAADDDSSAGRV